MQYLRSIANMSMVALFFSASYIQASSPCRDLDQAHETLSHDSEGFIYQYHPELYRLGVVKVNSDHGLCGVACFVNLTNLLRVSSGQPKINYPFQLMRDFSKTAKANQKINIADGMTLNELMIGIRDINRSNHLLNGIKLRGREMESYPKPNQKTFLSKLELSSALSKGPVILGISGFKEGRGDYDHYVLATRFKGNNLVIVDPVRPRIKLQAQLTSSLTPYYNQKSLQLTYVDRVEPRQYHITSLLTLFGP